MTTTATAPWRASKAAAAPQAKPQPKAAPPAELLVLEDETALPGIGIPAPSNDALMPRADTAVILEDFKAKVESLRKTAETLYVTSIEDTAGQKLARETRLAIRQIRLASDKKREEMVEGMTKEVRRINAGFKEIWDGTTKLEKRLQEQEDFIERETARLEDERRTARSNEIRPFLTSVPAADLGKITEEEYQSMLADARDLHALKLERERKAEEERRQREAAEAAERERIRQENERLRREAQEREAAAQREREEAAARQRELEQRQAEERRQAEAVLRMEREAAEAERRRIEAVAAAERAKVEEERRKEREAAAARQRAADDAARKAREEAAARQRELEAERQRIAEETAAEQRRNEEEARRAAAAPDREKLNKLADALLAIPIPAVSDSALHVTDKARARFEALALQIRQAAEGL